jgi:hypothetical protein
VDDLEIVLHAVVDLLEKGLLFVQGRPQLRFAGVQFPVCGFNIFRTSRRSGSFLWRALNTVACGLSAIFSITS